MRSQTKKKTKQNKKQQIVVLKLLCCIAINKIKKNFGKYIL